MLRVGMAAPGWRRRAARSSLRSSAKSMTTISTLGADVSPTLVVTAIEGFSTLYVIFPSGVSSLYGRCARWSMRAIGETGMHATASCMPRATFVTCCEGCGTLYLGLACSPTSHGILHPLYTILFFLGRSVSRWRARPPLCCASYASWPRRTRGSIPHSHRLASG